MVDYGSPHILGVRASIPQLQVDLARVKIFFEEFDCQKGLSTGTLPVRRVEQRGAMTIVLYSIETIRVLPVIYNQKCNFA
jgi:hypothetical protein